MAEEAKAPRIEYNYLLGRNTRVDPLGINDHELRRNSVLGMILNLGPTQVAVDSNTRRIYNVDFKFTDPSDNAGGYIIPGFFPQGDLISVFTTIGAPFLGAVSGATDSKYADELREKLQAETFGYRFANMEKYKPEGGGGRGGSSGSGGSLPSRSGGAPSEYMKRLLSAKGKGIRYSVGGPNGKFFYDENVSESADIQGFMRNLKVKNARWFKVEAVGKNGKLNLDDVYQFIG